MEPKLRTAPSLRDRRYDLLSGPVLTGLHYFIQGYSRTLRLKVENEGPWRAHIDGGGSVILCTWHQQFFSAIAHFRTYAPYRPSLMISQSKDGDIIARVAGLCGWNAVRGSSSRGGAAALGEMIENLKTSRLAGHIVDGPKGPAGRVKAGVIRLSLASGAHICPFSTAADRAWYFNSWDRFLLPKPFASVTIRFGPLIAPRGEGERDFESQRQSLEETMRPSLLAPHCPLPP
ncbi:MAG TPA: lysophospholipid acyltransferase family protein [Syntrophales bacterium]|nr:lysophospholipid acyltransferase family protein [Syntrophales bacterium]HOM07289.1 lysophospholipid acyltransferase family protein [Syntrophales bacterium]HOO00162.1 lysophospholipid acyltransferase family protein [Syntrophales bacterium]HPC01329.1 lysophospholipid acyltransferase family protein [Syntrophales bacterium]HPQ06866.1 lysophospholipid acyltransferase family protein [Syntrophales bacterium]